MSKAIPYYKTFRITDAEPSPYGNNPEFVPWDTPYQYYGADLVPTTQIAQTRGAGDYENLPRGPVYPQQEWGMTEPYNINSGTGDFFDSVPTTQENFDDRWSCTAGMMVEGKKQPKSYWQWARQSLGIYTPMPLLDMFFSDENVDYLQKRIINEVKTNRNVDINRQSDNSLLGIMQYYFLANLAPQTQMLTKFGGVKGCGMKSILGDLNKAVLQEAVREVLSGIDMYLDYYKHASSLPVPLDQPTYASQKGANVLSPNVGFEKGYNQQIHQFNQQYNIIPQQNFQNLWYMDSSAHVPDYHNLHT